MYCIHCGKQISDNARFCPECGKPLFQETPSAVGNEQAGQKIISPRPVSDKANIRTKKKQRQGSKKPIFKKWWFWVAAAIVLFIVGTNSGNRQSSDVENEKTEQADSAKNENIELVENKDTAVIENEPVIEGKTIDKDSKPDPVTESKTSPTPLSDFWITLGEDHSITLNSFDKHDENCVIPSSYIIDGETWNVKHVADACFFGRTSLDYLVIPEGVETIEHNAFNSCSVKEIYFPSSLTNIEGIFEYLDNRKLTVYYAGDADDWWAIKGADGITDNIELIGETPVPVVLDETNYSIADLTTERSDAEQLGGSLGNALNGLFYGIDEGLEEENTDK